MVLSKKVRVYTDKFPFFLTLSLTGYWPDHKRNMKILVCPLCVYFIEFFAGTLLTIMQIYEDIATFRGELKTMARVISKEKYDFLPPGDANLTPGESIQYIKDAIAKLLDSGSFLRNGVDENVLGL